MSASFDFSAVDKLAVDLGKAPAEALPKVIQAVTVTAHHVKDDWRQAWSGSGHVPGGASSISYDLMGLSAEIGPEVGGSGSLVGMLENGTPNTGPREYGSKALHNNEADFIKGIEKATEDIL